MRNREGTADKRGIAVADARDQLSGALRRAFPLPESGTFSDLLDALNEPPRHSPHRG